jgi:hypothetical protein
MFSLAGGRTRHLGMICVLFQLVACGGELASADIICADSSYVVVAFNRTYPAGSQFAGQPYDRITIDPTGSTETFFDINGTAEPDGLPDIAVRVFIKNCQGQPIQGLPRQQIVIFSPALCLCPSEGADGPTDANGSTTFTGGLQGGGVASSLDVYADGVFIGTLRQGGRTVKTNSPDQASSGTSPCYVDAGDLATFAFRYGQPATSYPDLDFNELDATIDLGDLAYFFIALGGACQ